MSVTCACSGGLGISSPVLICVSSLRCCCLPKPLQTPGSPAPREASAPSFATLLRTAYESEGALLDERVQAQLRAALPRLPLPQGLRAAKQLLLYVRSTVESFSQVSRAPTLPRGTCAPGLHLQRM